MGSSEAGPAPRAPGAGGTNGQLSLLIERAGMLRAAVTQAGGPAAIGRVLASRRDLTRADRQTLLWWQDDAVRGIFEVLRPAGRTAGPAAGAAAGQSAGPSAVTVLNLVDDLGYRVYGAAGQLEPGMFVSGTLLPLTADDEAWLASGTETSYPASDARAVARLAIDAATREPELVFRNPDKVKQGWEHMRRDREEFLAFFGSDEIVLPTVEAEGRLNAYYKRRQESVLAARGRHRAVSESGETTFVMPEGFFEFDTVGIIYDETDGFVVVPEYGMLRALFADPSLAADRDHADVLRAYLREDTIPPLPLRRVATAFGDNADAVFRRVLGNRAFRWREHGEGLLRKRKPGYYETGPLPCVAVLSDRVMELARTRR